MPFNAAALPGGWHYNGDVGRSCFVVVVVVLVVVGFSEGGTTTETLAGLVMLLLSLLLLGSQRVALQLRRCKVLFF